jgi:hypothetical protein
LYFIITTFIYKIRSQNLEVRTNGQQPKGDKLEVRRLNNNN